MYAISLDFGNKNYYYSDALYKRTKMKNSSLEK